MKTTEENKIPQEDVKKEETISAETEEQCAAVQHKKSIKLFHILGSKTAIIMAAVFAVGCLLYSARTFFIVATVNGSPISRLHVIKELEKSSGKKTLDMLIVQNLIDSEARSKGIAISENDVSEEIKIVEDQIKESGGTLDAALTAQGMTQDDLKNQIVIKKELEKLLADKIQVTDEETMQYITDNNIEIPKGEETTFPTKVKDYLQQQKLDDAASSLIDSLRSQATIHYFVNY